MRTALQFGFVAWLLAVGLSAQPRLDRYGIPGALPVGVKPAMLEGVGIEEHLGRQIDLNLQFTAESGYPVALSEYFHKGRPVILDLIYYSCPNLCTLVLNGQTQAMREILPWTPGSEYEIVTISIDPQESFDLARKKKALYTSSFDHPAPGWHFLCDRDGNAKKLAELIGYKYRWDERTQQFAHAAGIMVLTPDGKVARYLYGASFHPRDLRFALAEASENRTTMAVQKILLYCYHYDPQAGGYVLFATNLMRIGGVLTVLFIGFFLRRMYVAEHKKSAAGAKPGGFKEGIA
ncbi:MAG TPA: SCO family protein [Bryobacteraceae bacterium]|nr:SCO family protein [Bryobacteraceae bacterium]